MMICSDIAQLRFSRLAIAFAMVSVACSGSEDPPSATRSAGLENSIVEVANDNGLTTLAQAAADAGLEETLSSPGTLTVFAPTNDAFSALNVDFAGVSTDVLANILLQHVIGRDVPSSEVVTSPTLTTAANLPLVVDATDSPITIGGAALSSTLDVIADNGRVHVMDEVIVPPTTLDVATSADDFSILAAAVGQASQAVRDALGPNTLGGDAPITVFAPTNAAFEAAGIDLETITTEELDAVLSYHVVAGQALSSGLSDGQTIATLNGELTVKIDGGIQLVDARDNTINVTQTDVRTLTGVIHVIDAVLLPAAPPPEPTPDIVELATQAGLTTLVDLAARTNLAGALQGPGPLTVFAPTNAAFTGLNLDLTAISDDVIANILLQHVIGRDVPSTEVVTSPTLTTLANLPLAIDATQSPISIGGAPLSDTIDVLASNGRVHVLDGVIVPPTLLATAASLPDFSILVQAVGQASTGVQAALAPATLEGASPITVFAPTNAAFIEAGIDLNTVSIEDLDAILSYHAVVGQALSTDLSDGQTIETLNGSLVVRIASDGAVSLVDESGETIRVTSTDIRTLTGVIHVIDKVLMPAPPPVTGDIVDVAILNGFSSLVDLAVRTDLAGALRGPGPLTVFAPTNDAFAALPVDVSAVSDDIIANILLQHVIGRDVPSAEVVTSPTLTTLAKLPLAIDAQQSPISVGGAALSETIDVLATNGRIHVLNDVIVPPTTVAVAQATPALSKLVQAIGRASSAVQAAVDPATLSGASPITVFAPTDTAFALAGINLETISTEELDAVLSYHVVVGQALSSDLSDGQTIETLNGELTVNVSEDGSISLTDANDRTINVVDADIRTLSGVVHVIDRVLLPAPEPLPDIVGLATAGGLTTLVELAARTGLAPALQGPGPLTVFAPTNDAFAALHVDVSAISDDVIANILLQHVIGRDVPSTEVVTSPTLTTLANLPLVVDATHPPIRIGGAALGSDLDLLASNGRVHLMDQVIVPPTIVEVAEEQLTTLFGALQAAHLVGAVSPNTLAGEDPITVFAPTNEAFAAAGISLDHPPRGLGAILRYHVVRGQALAGGLSDGQVIHTVLGDTLEVDIDSEGNVFLLDTFGQRIRVLQTDIRTLTGVVHVIDGVLLPH